jgi:hypothetical protein
MIYRDPMGNPDAKATIGYVKCYPIGTKGYFSLSRVSDAPLKRWKEDICVNDIVTEMEREGWICVVHKDGYNMPRLDCIHRETQELIDKEKAENEKVFINAERGYIHFGCIPQGNKSYNHRDNCYEDGLSCFNAEFATNGLYRLFLTDVLRVSYYTVMDRQAYRVYGNVIAFGADGEPLLAVDSYTKIGDK